MSKCIFCGSEKISYDYYNGVKCWNCGKLRRICKRCDGELEYKKWYLCL